MDFVRNFSVLDKDDALIAGGKGASLGEMTQAGIPVPPGFVVLVGAFERFVETSGLTLAIESALRSVRQDDMPGIERVSEELQAMIENAKLPEDVSEGILQNFKRLGCASVAVRSSATSEDAPEAAWAGQLDTFLNTTENDLLRNVQSCWASLFNPRAIFYRLEKGLSDKKISVAVVVQKMIASEVSGIAFSVHPILRDRNKMIIEAAPGLGEAIVSGRVTPDSYIVDKEPLVVTDKNIVGQAQVLQDAKILELCGLVIKIEEHYGFPCDVEWASEGDNLYILQSRPITTLGDSAA